MPDFWQQGPITTIHHMNTARPEDLESLLTSVAQRHRIGLVLPITASDMRAAPFANIVKQLTRVRFLSDIVVVLNRAPDPDDFKQTLEIIEPLGPRAQILWTDGPRGLACLDQLTEAGFDVSRPGKGRAVWLAFGFLLADPRLQTIVLHDCDIVNYDNDMLVRLCLPMAHPSLDFDFCKAYYARCTDKMHGRVARLLVGPLLRALISVFGNDEFLVFMNSFRYPLAGEFAVSATLARSNRIPSDWGLEVGTLAEVFRNASPKKVAQVDLGRLYEHKHQPLSAEDPSRGLMKMASDIISSLVRTLSSRGIVFSHGHFTTLRSAYLRVAQDAIRQYHSDALINSLEYDRHHEENAIEAFAKQINQIGKSFTSDTPDPASIPTWTRVLAALPELPSNLRDSAVADRRELGS